MVEVTVTLTPEAEQTIKNFEEAPSRFPDAVRRGLDKGLQIVRGVIQRDRLTGHGPFPVSEHRLGEVSGSLRGATYAAPSEIIGGSVIGRIGSSASNKGFPYGLSHEYSAVVRGNPFLKFWIGNKFVVTRQAIIPEREPFTTELQSEQTALTLSETLSDEIVKEGGLL